MLSNTASRTLLRFLVDEFSCVGRKTALKIIELAGKQSDRKLSDRSHPKHIAHAQATALHQGAFRKRAFSAPRTDCIVPIGEKQLLDGLHKELEADFFTVTTRPAAAYRGNPFQVEVALAYGRPGEAGVEVDESGHMRKKEAQETRAAEQPDRAARTSRFACCVLPTGCRCSTSRPAARSPRPSSRPTGAAMACTSRRARCRSRRWRSWSMSPRSGCPTRPNPRRPSSLIRRSSRRSNWGCRNARASSRITCTTRPQLHQEYDRRTYIEKYLPHIGIALQDILALSDDERDSTVKKLDDVLHKSRTTQRPEP